MMADRAVLPMRFGTKLPGDDALGEVLAARQAEFLSALDLVRGRVEVGVRAMQPPGERAAEEPLRQAVAASGRAYLEAKLRDGRRIEREGAAVHEPLAGLAVASSRLPTGAPEELLRASYLIERTALAQFRATVERLQRTQPGVAILCTGPWPPYSFVAASPSEPISGAVR
jgi:hypothetical protein